ncbi:MAG: tRNA threonylcarbamoyladenosine biosynthesis protein TsaE [Patiriisocius sp.]|jgi:tRNA threonylcarbamoyladenosine biosynthesis protein TsaE
MKRTKFIVPNDLVSLKDNLKPLTGLIFELSKTNSIFLLNGEMGSGKTTLMVEIGRHFSISDPISSPTFSIVNEYETHNGTLVYHFDLYRLKDEEELYDIGFEDYLNKEALVFIEWPVVAKNFLPDNAVSIQIEQVLNGREIIVQHQ